MKVLISNMETIEKTTFDRIYALQVAGLVAREGSFATVAKILSTSPSNVTKEIQKLESYLGIKIFKRTTRSISLTEEGKTTLDKSKEIINAIEDLKDDLQGSTYSVKGSIRITAPTTLGQNYLSKLFAQFQLEYPYIEIDLIFTDRILDPIEHNIDLSVRTAFHLKDSNLYVKKLGKIERVICASPAYLEHFKKPKSIDTLHLHNCLLYMRGDSPFIWNFKKNNKNSNINVQGSYKSNNLLSLITACEMGVGLLNIPKYLVQEQIKQESLEILLKSWQLPAHSIFLLSSRKPSTSKRLKVLVDYLEDNLFR